MPTKNPTKPRARKVAATLPAESVLPSLSNTSALVQSLGPLRAFFLIVFGTAIASLQIARNDVATIAIVLLSALVLFAAIYVRTKNID
jgi:hypothetical protein